jgi:hypothetical protein
MPALVNSRVGSDRGTTEDEGTSSLVSLTESGKTRAKGKAENWKLTESMTPLTKEV